MTEAIVVEPLSPTPILIEALVTGAPDVIAIGGSPGPFGPVSNVSTTMAVTVEAAGGIIPGTKADLPVNWDGEIVGWELLGDLAGNVTVDILNGDPIHGVPYASITGGNKPHLTAVDAAAGDVIGWNSGLFKDDVLRYVVEASNTVRRLTIALFVERH